MVVVQVNPNFHTIGGKSVLRSEDPRFLEYRRKWREWPKSFTIGEFPLHLDAEATNACNLQCQFCAMSYEERRSPGYMKLEIFKKIIDEGAEHGLYALKFSSGSRGEPLLHKDLHKMIEYAKKKDIIDVYINTNATLLSKDVGLKLIEAGLDRISISFEGTTREVYEKCRVGASFEKVLHNIKEFIGLKDKMNSNKPLVRIQTVALPEIDLDEYKEFWEEIVDEVSFIDFKDYSHLQKNLISNWACPYLWQRMMVTWDGKISICGFDYSGNPALGNVKNSIIRSAWKGAVMEEIRKKHREGLSHEVEICNGCAFRTTEILKLMKGG